MNDPIVAEVTPAVVPRELKRPTKIRIMLKRAHGSSNYTLKSSHPLPTVSNVRELLPAGKKSAVPLSWDDYSLEHVINQTRLVIKPRQWADLIAKATTMLLAQEAEVESELLAVEGGAYLAIGNALLRCNVVDYLNTGEKALPALRGRVTEDARNEARAIINAAEVRKTEILVAAESQRLSVQCEIAKSHDQLNALRRELAAIPPKWATNVPLMFVASTIKYGIPVNMSIKRFVNHNGIWHARKVPSVPAMLWHPANTPFRADELKTTVFHPHCGSVSCLSIGDADGIEVNSYATWLGLAEKIERALEECNLNSLMWQYSQWHPGIQAMVPLKLKKALETGEASNATNFDEEHPKDALEFQVTPKQPEDKVIITGGVAAEENENDSHNDAAAVGAAGEPQSQPPE